MNEDNDISEMMRSLDGMASRYEERCPVITQDILLQAQREGLIQFPKQKQNPKKLQQNNDQFQHDMLMVKIWLKYSTNRTAKELPWVVGNQWTESYGQSLMDYIANNGPTKQL